MFTVKRNTRQDKRRNKIFGEKLKTHNRRITKMDQTCNEDGESGILLVLHISSKENYSRKKKW